MHPLSYSTDCCCQIIPSYMISELSEIIRFKRSKSSSNYTEERKVNHLQVTHLKSSKFRKIRSEKSHALHSMGIMPFPSNLSSLLADDSPSSPDNQGKTVPEVSIYKGDGWKKDLSKLKKFAPNEQDDSAKNAREIGLKLLEFYKLIFKRNSIDDKGMSLNSIVHFGSLFSNAFWTNHLMIYGDGDGEVFGNYTNSREIIAHEFTHGITQSTTGLIYQGQSGALNEHISDVFGIVFSQWSHQQTDPQNAHWLIGEEVILSECKEMLKDENLGYYNALRSISMPGTAYRYISKNEANEEIIIQDRQPSHMSGYTEDNLSSDDAVHINSGIPNKAFYLFAKELNRPSWEVAAQIWYRTITSGQIGKNATFEEFAKATIEQANNEGPEVYKALEKAWKEVGILNGENI